MKSGRIICIVSSHLIRTVVCNIPAFFSLIFTIGIIHAQVTQTPGGGSLNTQVNHVGNVYEITGGTTAGPNLFHSFQTFSVGSVETALFQTAPVNPVPDLTISNILGRVTGGDPSSILGTVDSASFYPNANLFLMNPAGFLFGPNATVNVGGMVAFTSADYLRLTDGVLFNNTPDVVQDALLSASPVAAFGFLGSNPGSITVRGGQFTLAEASGISLVGGNITIEAGTLSDDTTQPAGLSAPSGQINLASVASAGEILHQNLQTATNVNGDSFTTLGNITVSEGATLDVSGDGGGTIKIVGGQFVANQAFLNANTLGDLDGAATAVDINMTGDVIFTNGSAITLFAGGTGRLGDTAISGRNLTFDGASSITAINFDSPNGGGSITTTSQTVNILEGASWLAATFGSANSGSIGISASDSVVVSGDLATGVQSSIQTQSFGFATSGDITIATQSATIENLAILGTDSLLGQGGAIHIHGYLTPQAESLGVLSGGIIGTTGGDGSGAIIINAKDVTVRGRQPDLTSQIQSIGFGAGGTGSILMPQTERLVVADNARINLGVEDGNLNASSIVISASESVTLSNDAKIRMEGGGGGVLDLSSTTILIDNQSALQTIAGTTGDSTAILVKTDNLTLSGQSQINSSTLEATLGDGGTVTIQGLAGPASSVTIDGVGSGIITETNGDGAGGSVTVWANQVLLTNGASVSASSRGSGNTGNIQIDAGNQFAMTNSTVTTQANAASGGTIKITTTPSGTVQLTNSTISASVLDGAGGGGSVDIDPQFVILQNSRILAQAVQGPGGNIFITTNLLLQDAGSVISASSQFGVSGTVTIQSPNAPASGKIQPLGKTPLLPTSLLNQHCAALAGGEFSSFTVAGRDSLPTEPSSWLASPLYAAGVGEGLGVRSEGREGETALLSLRQIAPAGFLTQTFAVDWSAGCQS